jgi:hypothetical protein
LSRSLVPWAAAAIVLSTLAYYPVTANFFHNDDFFYLYLLRNEPSSDFILRPYFGHAVPLRSLTFWLLHLAFGTNPAPYFIVILLTHLLNVTLLFGLTLRLLESAPLAFLAATMWGVSPLHEGAVGWLSAYGEVCLTTIVLALLGYLTTSAARRGFSLRAAVGCSAVVLAASLFHATGLVIGVMFPILLALLVPAQLRLRSLKTVSVLMPLVPIGVYWVFHQMPGASLAPAPSLASPLHDPRGYAAYLPFLPIDLLALFSVGSASLILGPPSAAFLAPGVLAYATFACLGVAIALVAAGESRERRRTIGALFLISLLAYGSIAAGRGMLFRFFPGSSIAATPHYHYAATSPLAVLVAWGLARLPPPRDANGV